MRTNTCLPIACRLGFCLAVTLSGAVLAQPVRVFGPPEPGHARPPLWMNGGPRATPNTSYDYYAWFTPAQILHAYGYDQVPADGSGQVIAIVDAYGNQNIQFDLDIFCLVDGLEPTTVQFIQGQTNPGGKGNGWDLETSLDVEWAHAVAPNATIVLSVAASDSFSDMMNAVEAAVQAGATVVSMSWGGQEFSGETSYDTTYFAPNSGNSGVTFVASSGDSGEYTSGPQVIWPAASPYVVAVGGTSLYLNPALEGAYSYETAWSDSYGASGGGLSSYEPAPPWQAQAQWSPYVTTSRGVPDVSYVGDPYTGLIVFCSTYSSGASGWYEVGGTSASAPQWAATIALANQLRLTPLGTAGPSSIYSVAANPVGTINGNYFHDITYLSNGSDADDQATVGYDLVTGLGTPVATGLVPALAGLVPADAPLSVTPASQSVYAGNGNSATFTVTVAAGFSGTLNSLIVGPAGLTAAGASASYNQSGSTWTVAVTPAHGTWASLGYFPLTISATDSSGNTHYATAMLAVLPFSFSVSTTSVNAAPGSPAAYNITVTSYGWSGTVNLSLTGSPTGATTTWTSGSFYTFNGSGTFTTTLDIGAGSAAIGTYAPFIVASGDGYIFTSPPPSPLSLNNGETQGAGVILAVDAGTTPTFNLSMGTFSPGTVSSSAGGSSSSTVTMSPGADFTEAVTLSVVPPSAGSPLPSGCTYKWSTSPGPTTIVSGSSRSASLTVSVPAGTVAGTYTVSVNGTSGTGTPSFTKSATLVVGTAPEDFSLSANPSSLTVTRGGTGKSTITVTPSGGFTSTVTLTSAVTPSGPQISFSPTRINGGSGSSTMKVTTSNSTKKGNYTITVTGTSGSTQHSITVPLTVNQ